MPDNTAELFPDDVRNRKVARLLSQYSGEPFEDCLAALRRQGAYQIWISLRPFGDG